MNDNENSRGEINEQEAAQSQEPLELGGEEATAIEPESIDVESAELSTEPENITEDNAEPSTEPENIAEDGAESSTEPENIAEDGAELSTNPENNTEYNAEVPTKSANTVENNTFSPTESSDSSKPGGRNANRGILTAGVMLSTISIIVMIAISTCITIALVGSLGKVAFIPVVAIPYYSNDTDDSQVISDVMESVVVVSADIPSGGSTGSGIILSANGYIVTNYHVVEGATAIYVQLHGSSSNIKAELVGYSEHDDVAVIKINKTSLRPATFVSDCSTCKPGQRVYAIGSPKGSDYSYTVTAGIISSVNREVKIYDGSTLKKKMRMIQTDAAVNPGNSGGPIINSAGQVVGIVTLKLDGVDGMGFALPADGVLPLVNAIIENGSIDGVKSTIVSGRPLVGVTCVSVQKDVWYANTDTGIMIVTDEYAEENPDMVFKSDEDGVYVQSTSEGMDAHGKLFRGDVITKIGNTRVYTAEQLISVLNDHHGGDTVTLTVYRGGEYITVYITLKESPIE